MVGHSNYRQTLIFVRPAEWNSEIITNIVTFIKVLTIIYLSAMTDVLLYISMITGGILLLSLLLSLFSGLDLDMDVDVDDGGGMGYFKGGLTFISFASYVVRSVLISSDNWILAIILGVVVGGVAVGLLSWFLRWLLRNQEVVNYKLSDAVYKQGKVYLKIPTEGTGIVHVNIGGVNREMKAATDDKEAIPTGATILVDRVEGDVVYVTTQTIL